MNLRLKFVIINVMLLPACAQLPLTMPTPANATTTPMQQAWVNNGGAKADFKTLSECDVQAKIAAGQIMATKKIGDSIFDQLGAVFKESMEQNEQLTNCMVSKGYTKINISANQILPTSEPEKVLTTSEPEKLLPDFDLEKVLSTPKQKRKHKLRRYK